MKPIALVFMMIASPALAQDMVFDESNIAACVANPPGNDTAECIARKADRCMEQTNGGYSTAGMINCLGLEADWWDARLNAAYGVAMAQAKEMDGYSEGSSAPSQEDALRAMQRAWITFRDTKCAYERSFWGGGTGAGPAGVGCFLSATAEQTLYLENSIMN